MTLKYSFQIPEGLYVQSLDGKSLSFLIAAKSSITGENLSRILQPGVILLYI